MKDRRKVSLHRAERITFENPAIPSAKALILDERSTKSAEKTEVQLLSARAPVQIATATSQNWLGYGLGGAKLLVFA